MPVPEQPSNSTFDLPRFQRNRVVHIAKIVLLALLLALVKGLFNGTTITVMTLGVGVLLVAGAYWLAKRGATQQAAAILITSLIATLSFLVLRNGGVQDEAMLAFPALLVFAALVGNKWLMWAITLWTLLFIALLAWLQSRGWFGGLSPARGYSAYVYTAIILLVTAISVGWLASDLRNVLNKLNREHQKLTDSQAEISYMAHHDALTGLPNRLLIHDRFQQVVARAQRHQSKAALLFLDLDNFKSINDTHGHFTGDKLLKQIAEALSETLRASDTVGRQGGDEFLVLLDELHGDADAAHIAEKLIAKVEQTGREFDVDCQLSCSIGIAVYPLDARDFETLLKKADVAMYAAKRGGRQHHRFFEPSMAPHIEQRHGKQR